MGKKKDAIPQDVSEEEPNEVEQEEVLEEVPEEVPTEVPVDHNQALRDAISEARDRDIAEEAGLPPEEEVSTESDEVPEEDEEAEPEVDKNEEAPQAAAEDPEETLVVDGEERKVPLSKIMDAGRRTLQKESSADKKLEEATRLVKEAREIREAAERETAEKADTDRKEEPPEEDVSDEQYTAAIEAIQMGDTEEGTKALKQLLKGRRSASTTPIDKVALDVVQKELYRREQQSIREQFYAVQDEGGFSDLVPENEGGTGDHITLAAVNAEVARLIRDEKKPDVWATYKQAGLNVRKRFSVPVATEEPEPEDPTKQSEEAKVRKTERKRRLVSVKSAAGSPVTPDENEEENTSDVILEMRKQRGLT